MQERTESSEKEPDLKPEPPPEPPEFDPERSHLRDPVGERVFDNNQ